MARNVSIDILKGIAIIAVIMYHLGVSQFGYLGVDLFFVISGYLVAIGLIKSFRKDTFSYWSYLNKRLARLWPGLILISAASLVLGWFYMLPLHYKLNCESVVGTITFTNNFVQYITGGDYWTSANEFKPLMHTWYIGILMQFYVIIPMIFIIAKKCTKHWYKTSFYAIAALSVCSIIIYVSPLMSESQDFYMLPARFFELGAGCLLALAIFDDDNKLRGLKIYAFCILLLLSIIFVFCSTIGAMKLRLITVTVLSTVMVGFANYFGVSQKMQKILSPITFLGVASYSLYLSHQVFFAFYRYIVNNVFTTTTYLGVLFATLIICILLYFVFEKPLSTYISQKRNNMYRINGISVILVVILSSVSFYYYRQNGIVRDVPELGLFIGEDNQTPEEYNEIPHGLNKDFEDNGKKNILVIGDSFGRDWVNILHEASVDSVMNISYTMYVDENSKERMSKADFVFVATNLPFFESYNYNQIYPDLFNRKFWRLGLKSFGENFIGNIYSNRESGDYYKTTVIENCYSKDINSYERHLFKNNYIDMMTPIMEKDGSIKLFTDDKMLITEDGIHLTKAGAKWYAKKLDVWQYLK